MIELIRQEWMEVVVSPNKQIFLLPNSGSPTFVIQNDDLNTFRTS